MGNVKHQLELWMYYETCWGIRKCIAASVVVGVLIVVTASVSVLHFSNGYIASIPLAFFSESTVDGAAYYVYATAMSIISVLVSVLLVTQFAYIRRWTGRKVGLEKKTKRRIKLLNVIGLVLGTPMPFGFLLYSLYDKTRHPVVHFWGMLLLGTSTALYVNSETTLYKLLLDDDTAKSGMSTPTRFKVLLAFLLDVVYILRFPIGLVLPCQVTHMTMEECEKLNGMNDLFCKKWELSGSSGELTLLLSSDECGEWKSVFAICEFLIILLFMIFVAMLLFDDHTPRDSDGEWMENRYEQVQNNTPNAGGSGTDDQQQVDLHNTSGLEVVPT